MNGTHGYSFTRTLTQAPHIYGKFNKMKHQWELINRTGGQQSGEIARASERTNDCKSLKCKQRCTRFIQIIRKQNSLSFRLQNYDGSPDSDRINEPGSTIIFIVLLEMCTMQSKQFQNLHQCNWTSQSHAFSNALFGVFTLKILHKLNCTFQLKVSHILCDLTQLIVLSKESLNLI